MRVRRATDAERKSTRRNAKKEEKWKEAEKRERKG
jgi:hypothetical protein